MGRTMKRVPLDFDWPLGKIWSGYVNDKPRRPCPEDGKTCFNGVTGAYHWLEAMCQFIDTIAHNSDGVSSMEDLERFQAEYQKRGRIYPSPILREFSHQPTFHPPIPEDLDMNGRFRFLTRTTKMIPPTKQFAELFEAFSGERSTMMGNGSYAIMRAFWKAANLPENWGTCPVCKGHCIDPELYEEYESWEPTDPPAGEGYQLWNTTTEGHPDSPVFKTLDELAQWCESNATTFASFRTSAEQWKKMLAEDRVYHQEGNRVFC